jgi:low affinity Fe/Cu permease
MNLLFTRFANVVAHAAGRPIAFVACCIAIIAWAASGPIFGFSDTWQLVINTGTTIVTFLMVFLIQNTQNRDGAAIQAKLDELIRASEIARNAFVGLEHLTEEEVEAVRRQCEADADEEDRDKRLATPEALARSFDRISRTSRPR